MSNKDIIAKVKSRPELWQPQMIKNRRFVISKIWKDISMELGIDELLLRKKWKHLKDQFRKEHNKVLSKTIERSYWQNYDRLYFLSKDYQDQLAQTTEGTSEQTTEVTKASDDDKQSNSDSDEKPLKAKEPKKRLLKRLKTQNVVGMNALVTKSPDTGKLNLILTRLSAMEAAIENRKTTPEDTTRNDSDYMFILSLLPIMKKLSEIQKLQFRGKMNEWLLETVTQNEYSDRDDYKMFLQNEMVDKILPND